MHTLDFFYVDVYGFRLRDFIRRFLFINGWNTELYKMLKKFYNYYLFMHKYLFHSDMYDFYNVNNYSKLIEFINKDVQNL